MSRIGRKPIELPAGVLVAISHGRVQVNGPLGELSQVVPTRMQIEKTEEEIARILKEEGYINDYRVVDVPDAKGEALPYRTLVVELKFGRDRRRVITDLKRVSKPGRRVYAGKDRLPRVLGGLGTAIMSTPTGVITHRQAAERGVGGEVIAFVW